MTQDSLLFLIDRLTQAPHASALAAIALYQTAQEKHKSTTKDEEDEEEVHSLQSALVKEGSTEEKALYEAAEEANATWRRFIAHETNSEVCEDTSKCSASAPLVAPSEADVLLLTQRTLHALLQYAEIDTTVPDYAQRQQRRRSTQRGHPTHLTKTRQSILLVQMAAHALTPLVEQYNAEVEATASNMTSVATGVNSIVGDKCESGAQGVDDVQVHTPYARSYYAILPLLMRLLLLLLLFCCAAHRSSEADTKQSYAALRTLQLWQAYSSDTEDNTEGNVTTLLRLLLQPYVRCTVRPMATALRFYFRRGQPTALPNAPQHFFHFLRDAFASVTTRATRCLAGTNTNKREEEDAESCVALRTFVQLALVSAAIPVFIECYMPTDRTTTTATSSQCKEDTNTADDTATSSFSRHWIVIVNALADWVQDLMHHASTSSDPTIALALAQHAWLNSESNDMFLLYCEAMAECALRALHSGQAVFWRCCVLQQTASPLCCATCTRITCDDSVGNTGRSNEGQALSSDDIDDAAMYCGCTCSNSGVVALQRWLLPTRHFLRSIEAGLRRLSDSLLLLDATLVPLVWAYAVEPALRGYLAALTNSSSTTTTSISSLPSITFTQLPVHLSEAMQRGTTYIWRCYCAASALHLTLRAGEDWRGMLLDVWQQARTTTATMMNTLDESTGQSRKEKSGVVLFNSLNLSCAVLDELARLHDQCMREAVAHIRRLVDLFCGTQHTEGNKTNRVECRSASQGASNNRYSGDEEDDQQVHSARQSAEDTTATYTNAEDAMMWGLHTLEGFLCAMQGGVSLVMSAEEVDGVLRRSVIAALESSLRAGLTQAQLGHWQRWATRVGLTHTAALLTSVSIK